MPAYQHSLPIVAWRVPEQLVVGGGAGGGAGGVDASSGVVEVEAGCERDACNVYWTARGPNGGAARILAVSK